MVYRKQFFAIDHSTLSAGYVRSAACPCGRYSVTLIGVCECKCSWHTFNTDLVMNAHDVCVYVDFDQKQNLGQQCH